MEKTKMKTKGSVLVGFVLCFLMIVIFSEIGSLPYLGIFSNGIFMLTIYITTIVILFVKKKSRTIIGFLAGLIPFALLASAL